MPTITSGIPRCLFVKYVTENSAYNLPAYNIFPHLFSACKTSISAFIQKYIIYECDVYIHYMDILISSYKVKK